jgi:uncharacterized protein (DUF4213/DUF364 family)
VGKREDSTGLKILDDLLLSLKGNDFQVKSVHTCVFWTAVITKHCGLSSTFREAGSSHERGVRDVGSLTQKTALDLAGYARSNSLLEASIGMAAINSLVEVDESKCVEKNAFEILAEKGEGKNVAVVGHFPWIPRLKDKVKTLWVLEQRVREGDLPAKEAARILPECDVVGVTGTSFINHTLDGLLNLCKKAYIVMIGPTTPLSAILFDHGIDVICGTRVIDSEKLIRFISEGATFKEVSGVKLLTLIKS